MSEAKEPCAVFISPNFLSSVFFLQVWFCSGKQWPLGRIYLNEDPFFLWVWVFFFCWGWPELSGMCSLQSQAHNHKAKGRSWNAEDKAECKSIQRSNLRCGRSPLMHRKVLSVNEGRIFSLQNRAVFWSSGFPSALCNRHIKQLFSPSLLL